jgi:hypothetical protein
LTEAGRALLARAVPIWEGKHAEIDELVEDYDPALLRSSLRALS